MGLHPDGLDHPPHIPGPRRAQHGDMVTDEDWTVARSCAADDVDDRRGDGADSGLVLPGTVVYRVAFWEDRASPAASVAFATALDPLTVTFSALAFGFLAERVQARYSASSGGIVVGSGDAAMVFAPRQRCGCCWPTTSPGASAWAPTSPSTTSSGPTTTAGASSARSAASSSRLRSATAAHQRAAVRRPARPRPDERYVWILPLAAFWTSAVLILTAKRPHLPTAARPEAASLEAAG